MLYKCNRSRIYCMLYKCNRSRIHCMLYKCNRSRIYCMLYKCNRSRIYCKLYNVTDLGYTACCINVTDLGYTVCCINVILCPTDISHCACIEQTANLPKSDATKQNYRPFEERARHFSRLDNGQTGSGSRPAFLATGCLGQ